MARLIKSEKSSLPQIFYSIVQAIGRVVNLPVSIWIPDEKSQTLTIKASIGLPIAYVQKAYLRLSESSVTGEAFKSGKVIEVHSILSDPRWKYKKEAQEMGWNSVLCVPIKVRKSVVGVISIYSFVARNFSEMEKRLLFDYASQLELSIEAERMKETLNRLFDLGQNIEKKIAKQPKVILQEIVNTFSDITGADCVVLYPYDYQRENFFDINNVAACGLRTKLNPSDKPRIEGGMAAFVKLEGKVVIEDIKKEYPAMLDSPFISREGIRSFIGIALAVSNRPLGILYIDFRAPRSFSQDEQRIIQLFAHQAAIAINNAHLYQHINSRARALSKLHKVTPRLVSVSPNPKNLKSVLNLIAKDAQMVLGADLVDLYQYDQNKDDFILPPVQLGTRYEPFSIIDKILEDDIVRKVIKTGSLYATNAQEEKPLIQPSKFVRPRSPKQRFVVREKIQSMAGIPLAVGNEIVGVLFANYRSSQTFSRQQKELIELFAGQAAIAIYNSRLFHQARQQSKALEKLQSIGVDLISLTGTSESLLSVLKKIAYSAQEVLKADLVDLYQYFEESDKYELPPVQVGKRNAPYVRKEKIQEDDVIWSIVKNKKAKYTSNSQDSTELNTSFAGDRTGLPVSRFVIREEIKSTAAVPLKVGSTVVGILFANYRSPQTFLPQQRTLIELFAAQAAIAIHNSRLYWESIQRSMRLELVNNIAAAISSTTDAKTILQIAVNGLAKVLGVKQSAVAIFDEAGEFADVLVEYLEPDCVSALGHKIPLKNNAQIEKILKTKKPLIIDDVQNDPIMERTRKLMAKRKTLSLMVVPILIDEKVAGTIGVDAVGEKRHFTDEETELAQAIANQAATTLRIAQQLEKRLNDVRALQEITEQMHKGDLKEVLNLIAEHAVDLTKAKHGGVWLVNKTRTALEFGGLAHKSQYQHVPPNISLDESSGNSFGKWVVLNKKSYKSGNVHKDKQYKPYYKDTRSELTVPIVYREKVIGTINVESPIKDNFSDDDSRLLEAMAGQAAIVVQNARLLERLNALDDIGVELTSGTRLKEDEILESIYNQVQRLTGAQDMYIALYDEHSNAIRFPLATQKGKQVLYPSRKANMEKRGKTEEIIFTRKPILHKTKKEAEQWYGKPGHEEKVGIINPSWLGVPIMLRDRVLGVIAIYDTEQEHAYDDEDVQVFSSLANQAAFALVNQELNRRNVVLATLNDVGRELTSGIRLREENILSLIFNQTKILTDAQDLYIALYDESTGEIRFSLATEKGKPVTYRSRKANMESRGKTEEIIFTRKPILHKTLREAKEWYSQFGHAEFIGNIQPSWLGVPMMVDDKILGVIAAVDLDREYAYDELHLEVLSAMASQAAIAIQNSRLYEQARSDAIANRQLATLGTAIAALQHRINNTLNIISPNVTRLRDHLSTQNDPEVEEILGIIDRNTRYTSTLLNRIQTPLQEVGLVNVDVNAVLTEIFNRQKREWTARTPIELAAELELDPNIPVISLPIGQISEVFSNLIDNAYRALDKAYRDGGTLKKGAKVEVEIKLDKGDTIKVRVTDNVPDGIPLPVRARLFDKPVPSRTPGEGSGLGLWLSKLIMQRIGGDIRIEETGIGGTTMLVEIPLPK